MLDASIPILEHSVQPIHLLNEVDMPHQTLPLQEQMSPSPFLELHDCVPPLLPSLLDCPSPISFQIDIYNQTPHLVNILILSAQKDARSKQCNRIKAEQIH
jgi:hypothetical protein